MKESSQCAASLHFEYRASAENKAQVLSDLMTAYPSKTFPKQEARIWQAAMLAEIWGTIATKLSITKRDYIQEWRTGK